MAMDFEPIAQCPESRRRRTTKKKKETSIIKKKWIGHRQKALLNDKIHSVHLTDSVPIPATQLEKDSSRALDHTSKGVWKGQGREEFVRIMKRNRRNGPKTHRIA